MKKLIMSLLALTLVFGVSGAMYPHDANAAGKKSYNSGTKSFQQNNNVQQDRNTNISKPDTNKSNSTVNSTPAAAASKGGFMKGMLMGGVAGLLLGGLFSHLGSFGPILGLLLNAACIALIVMFAVKIFQAFKRQRKTKEDPSWRN